jgi:hypothetical protein
VPAKRTDHIGQRFGKLTVLEQAPTQGKRSMIKCACDCGNICVVRQDSVLMGKTQSCGCLQKEAVRVCNTKHGMYNTRLYRIWVGMLQRCENSQNPNFKRYGARGISVTKEWHDFEMFRDWALNTGYSDILEIDRIDNNGNYEPVNCQWVTHSKNNRNKRNNRLVTVGGRTQSLTEWAVETGMPVKRLANRIERGWDPERAIANIL